MYACMHARKHPSTHLKHGAAVSCKASQDITICILVDTDYVWLKRFINIMSAVAACCW